MYRKTPKVNPKSTCNISLWIKVLLLKWGMLTRRKKIALFLSKVKIPKSQKLLTF